MAIFKRHIQIDFASHDGVGDFLKQTGLDPKTTPELELDVEVDVDIEEFGQVRIIEAFADICETNGNWLERIYRLLAEGDTGAAMEELHAAFPTLAPPAHERAIADLLTGKRSAAHG